MINVNLDNRTYPIHIESGLLETLEPLRDLSAQWSQVLVISNETVFPLYGDKVLNALKALGCTVSSFNIPDGEEYKTSEWANKAFDQCMEIKLDRKSCIIALGGGVVGDLAGFVAASFMRGVNFVQISTTLLSHVDSSVGGKVAVNHPQGKNMIGFFYQPQAVIIDIDTLQTLPEREFKAGMAEVVKYGVILDADFFNYLEDNMDAILSKEEDVLKKVIARCCELKAQVVSEDEKEETGRRAILNFGHTLGHAIEAATNYKQYLHGEAIAIGMILAAKLACNKKMISIDDVERLKNLLETIGLPTKEKKLTFDDIVEPLKRDKKFAAGQMNFILPQCIGNVILTADVSFEEIRAII